MEILFLSFSLPWFLIIVERFFPYPYIFEEVAKLGVVFFILKEEKIKKKNLLILVLIFAFGFTFSEAILYLNNIFQIGIFSLFFVRLILTGFLHGLTSIIIYIFGKNFSFWGLMIGLLLAMIIHYCFNRLINVYFI